MTTLTHPTTAPPTTARTSPMLRTSLRGLVRDTTIVTVRELRPILHDPFSLVFSLVQPLVFLALFGPLLVGSLGGSAVLGGTVWQWFVPAILLMSALFGTATTGSNLLYEFQTGAHERMLVTPLSRPALLIGRALKEVLPLTGQALVLIAVMIPFGFRLHPLGALAGLALLGVLGIGLGALSNALAIAVREQDWMFWVVHQTVIFPLMILSGMLLPLETGPGWMQAAAQTYPITGPQVLTPAERTGLIGEAIGQEVVFERLSEARERDRLRSYGYPEDYVEFGHQLATDPPPQAAGCAGSRQQLCTPSELMGCTTAVS